MGEKNDANDAMAIFEASQRPKIHYVSVKTESHQIAQLWIRKREALIGSRTELINSTRSYLGEFGHLIPLGVASFVNTSRQLLAEQKLDPRLVPLLERDLNSLAELNKEIRFYDDKIKQLSKTDPICREIQKLEGVGPITAVAVRASVVNPHDFKNGRQYAASLGLVPRQNSTGGRTRLLGITKSGNRYIRQLLIHGGRSFLWKCGSKNDPKSVWANQKRKERGFNKACVAIANKNARNLWGIMSNHPEKALAI